MATTFNFRRNALLTFGLCFFFLQTCFAQNPFGYIQSEGQQAISEYYVIQSECANYISTCPGDRPSCASGYCAQCTGVGYQVINSCCATGDPAPTACFAAAVAAHPPISASAYSTAQYSSPYSMASSRYYSQPTMNAAGTTPNSGQGGSGGSGDQNNSGSGSGSSNGASSNLFTARDHTIGAYGLVGALAVLDIMIRL